CALASRDTGSSPEVLCLDIEHLNPDALVLPRGASTRTWCGRATTCTFRPVGAPPSGQALGSWRCCRPKPAGAGHWRAAGGVVGVDAIAVFPKTQQRTPAAGSP